MCRWMYSSVRDKVVGGRQEVAARTGNRPRRTKPRETTSSQEDGRRPSQRPPAVDSAHPRRWVSPETGRVRRPAHGAKLSGEEAEGGEGIEFAGRWAGDVG